MPAAPPPTGCPTHGVFRYHWPSSHRLFQGALLLVSLFGGAFPLIAGGECASRKFAIRPGDASSTLEAFSDQAGTQIVYLVDQVRGVRTNGIDGTCTVREALGRLLAGTPLRITEDEKTGAIAIVRQAAAPAQPQGGGTVNPQPTPTRDC